ncbi:MAG TPA: glycosyltransferase family 4 protein, partial [Candidatus Binatus sp.]|nr:glycosyltransferase family 4 protein [Candidatus Binatus sp.]
YLIEAIGALADRGKFRCLIAGQGSIGAVLQGEIAIIRCTDRIKLLGGVDDTRELLWASDAFAMPSLKEGLGVAALEAMAAGLPVIASDVGGLRDAVEHDRTGIVVPAANPEAIASAIEWLAKSDELRARMGAAARARAVEKYSTGQMAAQTLAVYRACLEKPRRERDRIA